MDKLAGLRAFVKVVESGSFAEAGRHLRLSRSAISKYVGDLEESLGVQLLNRTTRSVSLTDAGLRLLDRLRPAVEQISRGLDDLKGEQGHPFGHLRLYMTHLAGAAVIAPVWARFLSSFPDVQLEVHTAEAPADIVAKMVEGSVTKYLKEVSLLNQTFVKNDKQTVEQMLKEKGTAVKGFTLYVVGEGIEKKVDDFAAEVAAQVAAAKQALDRWGYGMASVRFICGTQETHKELERRLAGFLGTEDVILYSSCFDANGGLFETLLDERDAVISDALNHASIIDGIRLCKAQRLRYANSDMGALENCLRQAQGARTRLIATDGVFSMDGFIANLRGICELAERYGFTPRARKGG